MNCQLKTQLENAAQIKEILKEVSVEFRHEDGRKLTTLLVYLPSTGGATDHTEFFEAVKEGLLCNFVFSCSEIEKKLGVESNEAKDKIFAKALRKLSKHTAKGELGELMLFTLLDVYFEAPKILSKISMKTNPRMPVFGADAVHSQFVDGDLKLYLGESKLHKNFKSASTSAADSINSAFEKYITEFDLIDSHIDFAEMDEELKNKLIEILDPFTNKDIDNVINSPCFIGFAEPSLISDDDDEIEFIKSYVELAEDYVAHFFSQVEKQEMSIDDTALLMLPFASLESLVDEFIDTIGIEE